MNGFGLAHAANVALPYVEGVLALIALTLLGKKHAWGQYKSLAAILVLILWGSAVSLLTLQLFHPADRHLLYEIYFYSYWSSYIVQAILMLVFCYGILTRLFSSSPKLRSISTLVFLGIVFLWCAMSASLFFNPHLKGVRLVVAAATQLQVLVMGVSFLTAMVVFVCVRPLGLQLRSPLSAFGLGLMFSAMGIFSGSLRGGISVQQLNWLQIFSSGAVCALLICWVAAISWLEPARQTVNV